MGITFYFVEEKKTYKILYGQKNTGNRKVLLPKNHTRQSPWVETVASRMGKTRTE